MLDLPLTTPEDLLHSPGLPIDQDWEGAPAPKRIAFLLGRTDKELLFGASFPAGLHGIGAPGQFREGLWHGNVFELFVHSAESDKYCELNLSPTGAWWSMFFDGYRKRVAFSDTASKADAPAAPSRLSCAVHEITIQQTTAAILEIPLRQLFRGQLLIGQAAIIREERERFFVRRFAVRGSPTARAALKRAPDFHLREIAEAPPNA